MFFSHTNKLPIGKMNFSMSLKVISKTVCHVRVYELQGPFWKLKEGEEVNRNACQASFD